MESYYTKLPKIIAAIVVLFLTYVIISAGNKMHNESDVVRDKCTKTDYYVIGDKGHRNRIYDCTGVQLSSISSDIYHEKR